jgi:hypothetical protein
LPDFVEPMQAKLVDSHPAGDWIFEIKFAGDRARKFFGALLVGFTKARNSSSAAGSELDSATRFCLVSILSWKRSEPKTALFPTFPPPAGVVGTKD